MILRYFVKFQNNRRVDIFEFKDMEELLYKIKEFMSRNNTGILEWMIIE